jgi:Transglycosylase-like domain/LysM domain
LGSHRKPSRRRLPHLVPTAAGPALAATAAAVCLAPQAMADPAPAHAAAEPAVVADAVSDAGLSAELFTAKQRAAGKHARPAPAVTYTVRAGDSLSSIAGRLYHRQAAWPVLYWANRNQIRWANVIGAGQKLTVPALPATIPSVPSALGQAAPAPVVVQAPATSAPAFAPAQAHVPAAAASTFSGGTPGGSFGACVVAHESGGNAQVMNSSGHYGLYQFSESTWVAYGGSAADFGHASVAEQNQVFASALAQGGQSNWSSYDGC